MDKLKLLMLAESQDVEAFEDYELEEENQTKKQKYKDFYDDVKQPSDYIKEDW